MFNYIDIRGMFGKEFSRESYSMAVAEAQGQLSLWINTIDSIKRSINSYRADSIDSSYLEKLLLYINRDREKIFTVSEIENRYVISGMIPVILKESTVINHFMSANPARSLAVAFSETAEYFYSHVDAKQISLPDHVLMYAGAYLAEKDSPLVKSLEDSQKIASSLSEELNTIKEELATGSDKLFNELKVKHYDMIHQSQEEAKLLNQDRTEIRNKWDEFLEKSSKEIEAAKNLAFENEALKAARDVWSDKTKRHRRNYWFGISLLTILVSAMVFCYFRESAEIQSKLLTLRKPDGDIPYSLIIFYIIPIIAIGWIFKMFGRFVMNSMILSEDAEQRQAMLDTYFRLVGDASAKMEPTDRVLILNAIFRPLPGQQSEDISPPSVLDLAQSVLPKKSP